MDTYVFIAVAAVGVMMYTAADMFRNMRRISVGANREKAAK